MWRDRAQESDGGVVGDGSAGGREESDVLAFSARCQDLEQDFNETGGSGRQALYIRASAGCRQGRLAGGGAKSSVGSFRFRSSLAIRFHGWCFSWRRLSHMVGMIGWDRPTTVESLETQCSPDKPIII